MASKQLVKIDEARQEIFVRGKIVTLTPSEWKIMLALRKNQNKTMTRDELLDVLGGEDCAMDPHSINVHVARLRRKIGVNVVETSFGFGYKWARP